MKKIIIVILLALLIFTGFGCSQKEEKLIKPVEIEMLDNWQLSEEDKEKFSNFWSELYYPYYFFVYGTPGNTIDGLFFGDRIGPADYKEGYLYVKDSENNKLYQLSTTEVENCYTTENLNYVFVYNNDLYELKDDLSYEMIYDGSGKINFECHVVETIEKYIRKYLIYFLDGEKLIKYSTKDYSYEVLCDKCVADYVDIKTADGKALLCTIEFENAEDIDYIINLEEGYQRPVLNYFEIDMFLFDKDFVGQETEYTYQKIEHDPPVFGDPKY